MVELKIFDKSMQNDIGSFCEKCYADLGWGYDPIGRHSDMSNINEAYMKNGCMWCLYDANLLIGTVAVKNISANKSEKIIELKRMFVLKEYQGKGYGRLLLETAIAYAREEGYDKIFLDTRIELRAAIDLYRKYGFVETPAYNDNAKAELFMELKL